MHDDTQLLADMAAGDGTALEQLYDAHARQLLGFGRRLLGDAGLAEELVQETFVRVWQRARTFDPGRASVRTFIFTIARSVAVDLWRRPSSRPLELAEEERSGDHAEEVVTSVVVREAMSSLSEAHREVLELLHFQQFTQSEAAIALDIPLGTVKTRAYHAARALRTALGGRGVGA